MRVLLSDKIQCKIDGKEMLLSISEIERYLWDDFFILVFDDGLYREIKKIKKDGSIVELDLS